MHDRSEAEWTALHASQWMPLARCPLGHAMDVAETLSPVSTHGRQGSLENPGARDGQKVASSPSGPMFSEMVDPG